MLNVLILSYASSSNNNNLENYIGKITNILHDENMTSKNNTQITDIINQINQNDKNNNINDYISQIGKIIKDQDIIIKNSETNVINITKNMDSFFFDKYEENLTSKKKVELYKNIVIILLNFIFYFKTTELSTLLPNESKFNEFISFLIKYEQSYRNTKNKPIKIRHEEARYLLIKFFNTLGSEKKLIENNRSDLMNKINNSITNNPSQFSCLLLQKIGNINSDIMKNKNHIIQFNSQDYLNQYLQLIEKNRFDNRDNEFIDLYFYILGNVIFNKIEDKNKKYKNLLKTNNINNDETIKSYLQKIKAIKNEDNLYKYIPSILEENKGIKFHTPNQEINNNNLIGLINQIRFNNKEYNLDPNNNNSSYINHNIFKDNQDLNNQFKNIYQKLSFVKIEKNNTNNIKNIDEINNIHNVVITNKIIYLYQFFIKKIDNKQYSITDQYTEEMYKSFLEKRILNLQNNFNICNFSNIKITLENDQDNENFIKFTLDVEKTLYALLIGDKYFNAFFNSVNTLTTSESLSKKLEKFDYIREICMKKYDINLCFYDTYGINDFYKNHIKDKLTFNFLKKKNINDDIIEAIQKENTESKLWNTGNEILNNIVELNNATIPNKTPKYTAIDIPKDDKKNEKNTIIVISSVLAASSVLFTRQNSKNEENLEKKETLETIDSLKENEDNEEIIDEDNEEIIDEDNEEIIDEDNEEIIE